MLTYCRQGCFLIALKSLRDPSRTGTAGAAKDASRGSGDSTVRGAPSNHFGLERIPEKHEKPAGPHDRKTACLLLAGDSVLLTLCLPMLRLRG